jgi:hypothetical protein
MKKSITSFTIFIAVSIFWAANVYGQSITIEKRHYKGGYYIDFGKNKKKVKANIEQNVASTAIRSIPTGEVSIPVSAQVETEQLSMFPVQNVVVKKQKLVNKISSQHISVSATEKHSEVTENTVARIANNEPEAVTRGHDDAAAGLSIILIIIIVLVVLWLLGILLGGLGLGFLLYLLLIVALILLILYLLRMVR